MHIFHPTYSSVALFLMAADNKDYFYGASISLTVCFWNIIWKLCFLCLRPSLVVEVLCFWVVWLTNCFVCLLTNPMWAMGTGEWVQFVSWPADGIKDPETRPEFNYV